MLHSLTKIHVIFFIVSIILVNSVASEETWQAFSGQENVITAIIEDGKFLWTGTQDGLTRWKKTESDWVENPKRFTSKDGLINNQINCIVKKQNILWIGTEGGISSYDYGTLVNTSDDEWKSYLSGIKVRDVKLDASNTLWFATNKGLYSFNGNNWLQYKTTNSGIISDNVFSVAIDNEQENINIWVGTDAGAVKFDGKIKEWSDSFNDKTVYSILADEQFVWFGTSSGVERLQDENELTHYIETKPWVSHIVKNKAGEYIFVTSHGIYTANSSDLQFTQRYSGGGNYFLEDSSNHEWLGSNDGLLHPFSNYRRVAKTQSGLASNTVNSILVTSDSVWFGTDEGLSHMRDASWESFTKEDTQGGLQSNSINDLAIDASDQLWIATKQGLSQFYDETWVKHLENKMVFAVCATVNNETLEIEIWAAVFRKGIYRYANGSWIQYTSEECDSSACETITALPYSNTVNVIHEDTNGKIWFGGSDGILSYDPARDVWESNLSRVPGVIDKISVNDIISDPEEGIWIATDEGLLYHDPVSQAYVLFNPGPSPTTFTALSLSPKKTTIIAGTSNGFYQFDGAKFNRFHTVGNSEIFSGNIKTLAVDDPQIWFGFGETGGGTSTVEGFFVPLLNPAGLLTLFFSVIFLGKTFLKKASS